MAPLVATDYLLKLFEIHEITCIVENDWIIPNSELPAICGRWYPGEACGRLDIQLLIADKLVINESFGGVGQGEAAMHDAIMNFATNIFHVLLAALWGQNDTTQVTTKRWDFLGKHYNAYIGNFGTRNSAGVTPYIPDKLLAGIESVVMSASLNADIHWFRCFFCNVAGKYTFEALKDNENWDAGVHCLQVFPWQKNDGYYSVRLFMVLRAC